MVTSLPDYDEPTKGADLLEQIFRPINAPLGEAVMSQRDLWHPQLFGRSVD